jgi:trehalose 6-phosphate synthase
MNLVAKEFVSARDDDRGVLILSRFAGAARQLTGALIVNPYAIDDSAHALAKALNMPADEQSNRMSDMRSVVAEFSAYWWAGQMLQDAARLHRPHRGEGSKRSRMRRHTETRVHTFRSALSHLPVRPQAAKPTCKEETQRVAEHVAVS